MHKILKNRSKTLKKKSRKNVRTLDVNGTIGDPVVDKKLTNVIFDQYIKDSLNRKDNFLTREELVKQAPLLFREVLRFLRIKVYTKSNYSPPSVIVDYMWHAFVLCTETYIEFCMVENNGKMIHHNPGLYVAGTEESERSYENGLVLYTRLYKSDPPQEFWPRYKHTNDLIQASLHPK